MLKLLTTAILLSACTISCVVDSTPTDPTLDTVARPRPDAPRADAALPLPPPPHTGPGAVSCWRRTAPGAACSIPGLECIYSQSYGLVGACAIEGSTPGFSTTRCDGPEDCVGQLCCANVTITPFGERYAAACSASSCEIAGDNPLGHVTLCDPGAATTGCPAGKTCVRAGAPKGLFDVNHSGLQPMLWFCQ